MYVVKFYGDVDHYFHHAENAAAYAKDELEATIKFHGEDVANYEDEFEAIDEFCHGQSSECDFDDFSIEELECDDEP